MRVKGKPLGDVKRDCTELSLQNRELKQALKREKQKGRES